MIDKILSKQQILNRFISNKIMLFVLSSHVAMKIPTSWLNELKFSFNRQ